VAKLQSFGCNSVGFTGADGNTIIANKRSETPINYGFAGDIVKVDISILKILINNNITNIFSAISHDEKGQLLNTNADTIASELAIAFSNDYKVELYYCFEKKGVLQHTNDENSVIKKINNQTYIELKKSNIISEGMIPKLDNCFYALDHNVSKVCIGQPTMLFDHHSNFTTIQKL
jgi:acetylglutamate kinase